MSSSVSGRRCRRRGSALSDAASEVTISVETVPIAATRITMPTMLIQITNRCRAGAPVLAALLDGVGLWRAHRRRPEGRTERGVDAQRTSS